MFVMLGWSDWMCLMLGCRMTSKGSVFRVRILYWRLYLLSKLKGIFLSIYLSLPIRGMRMGLVFLYLIKRSWERLMGRFAFVWSVTSR